MVRSRVPLAGVFTGVILSVAVFQAERRIQRAADPCRARSLAPLVKARGFGMTPGSGRHDEQEPYWLAGAARLANAFCASANFGFSLSAV